MRINEIFRSVQGESTSAGLPTIFVRTAGCHLRCTYCDTAYAWTTQGSTLMSVDEVMEAVRAHGTKRVCLTGGEPLLQPEDELQQLFDRLAAEGYELSIETSGACSIEPFHLHEGQRWILDMKVPSSGETNRMHYASLALLRPQDEVKFVVGDPADFEWAVDLIRVRQLEGRVNLLFSPVWDAITPLQLTELLLGSGIDARLQIQLHKIIWDPSTRGV